LADVKAEGHVLRFLRGNGDKRAEVVMNLGLDPVRTDVSAGKVLASTGMDRDGERVGGAIELKGGEGLMIELAVTR
jgi:alpha-glucosidase